MQLSHAVRALLMPASVALVGASSKPGSIGRIVLENLLGGAFHGTLYVVNPNHRRVLGRRSYASLARGPTQEPVSGRQRARSSDG